VIVFHRNASLPTTRKKLDAWVEATSLADLYNYVIAGDVFEWAGDDHAEATAIAWGGPAVHVCLVGKDVVNKARHLVFWLKQTGRVVPETRLEFAPSIEDAERAELRSPWVENEQTYPVAPTYDPTAVPAYYGDPALTTFEYKGEDQPREPLVNNKVDHSTGEELDEKPTAHKHLH